MTDYAKITKYLSASQDRMTSLIDQISSGKRVSKPSDDPVAAAQALLYQQAKSIAQSEKANAEYTSSLLGFSNSALQSLQDQLADVHVEAFYSKNATLSGQDLKNLGEKVSAMYQSMLATANSASSTGPLYSGYSRNTPFSSGGYAGDQGSLSLPIGDSQSVIASDNGFIVKNGLHTSVLEPVKQLADSLLAGNPATPAMLESLEEAVDLLGQAQTSVGSRMQVAENAANNAEDKIQRYASLISKTTDLDYGEAIAALEKDKAMTEALQKVFVSIQGQSLAKYL